MAEASPLDRLSPGDHVCLVVDDEPSRSRGLVAYIRAGLQQHHRILYQGQGAGRLRVALAIRGVDVTRAMRSDQLRLIGSGVFDPAAAIDCWRQETARSRAAGFAGLRAVGDMSGACRCGADRLAWYESEVSRLLAEGYASAVCLYDRRLFSAADLRRVTCSHPTTITHETDPDAVPLLRGVRTVEPRGLRLEGEADLSNRHALRALMDHLAEDAARSREVLIVDLGGLRFIDAAAARILVGVAGTRIVGCSPAISRLLAMG
ncbi:MEDS domain-containing protein [Actinoplanes sp. NPDC051851]|uniref:MEDS domain-containing protein n=1 Tax=Actinoplanes sp. NPDC051851 TaxID=3154753 RepID=UPI003419B593